MKPLNLNMLSVMFLTISILAKAQVLVPQHDRNQNDSLLNTKVHTWIQNNRDLKFIENKGQMVNMQGMVDNDLLFEADAGGMNIYITTSGLSYVFTQNERHEKNSLPKGNRKHIDDSIETQYCRADMELLGATIKKENIIKEGESAERKDYYLGGICPNGVLNVHTYNKVIIKNIYPGIDWILYSENGDLKYDFIV